MIFPSSLPELIDSCINYLLYIINTDFNVTMSCTSRLTKRDFMGSEHDKLESMFGFRGGREGRRAVW